MKNRILRFLISLFVFCLGTVQVTVEGAFEGFAQAGESIGEGIRERNQLERERARERAIFYGRLRAEGLTREFLNDASFNDLISLIAFIDQLRAMRTSPEDIKSHLAEIEKEYFKQKEEAAAFKKLKAKDRKRLTKSNKHEQQ